MTRNKNKRKYANQSEINKLFNSLYEPEVDNLDCIVLYGYYDLSNTEKIAYLFISHLYRDDIKVTSKLLTIVMKVTRKTVHKCLLKLESLNLIEKRRDYIYPLLPNPKNESFRETITLLFD